MTSYNIADYTSGSTEPWCADIVGNLVRNLRAKAVLELGAFEGRTTRVLSDAVQVTGGHVNAVESDSVRAAGVRALALPNVSVHECDALDFIRNSGVRWNLVFVDDDHTYAHVAEEVETLLPLMAFGGVICMHDVVGAFGLDRIVHRHGGIVLHTRLLHTAGGLGLISVHDPNILDADGRNIGIVNH